MKQEESSRKRSNPTPKKKLLDRKGVRNGLVIIAVIVIIAGATLYFYSNKNNTTNNNQPAGNPIAVFNTTLGTFKVELFEDKMPITVGNFVKLVNDRFYDGMIFHRISANFMIQGGGYLPDGTHKDSPYGNIQFETSDVTHVDGAISMASTGAKVGGSNEFFICDGAQPGLDGNYAAFGVTIQGIDVIHTIASKPHADSGDGTGRPTTDIIIRSITIE